MKGQQEAPRFIHVFTSLGRMLVLPNPEYKTNSPATKTKKK
jgi:hypothetical protein